MSFCFSSNAKNYDPFLIKRTDRLNFQSQLETRGIWANSSPNMVRCFMKMQNAKCVIDVQHDQHYRYTFFPHCLDTASKRRERPEGKTANFGNFVGKYISNV